MWGLRTWWLGWCKDGVGKRRLAAVDGGPARHAGGSIDGTDLDAVVGVGRAKEVLLMAHGLAGGGLTGGAEGVEGGGGAGGGVEVGPILHPRDGALGMGRPHRPIGGVQDGTEA